MNISSSCTAGRLTVYLSGELDHHEARYTVETIEDLIEEYLPRDCILDLSGLSFMDSSGIAVIVRTGERMRTLRGRIWVENPGKQVMRVLDAAGIDRLVPVSSPTIGGLT